MAIVAHVVLPGLSKEDYDRVRQEAGWLEEPPVGGISHPTWWEGEIATTSTPGKARKPSTNFGQQRLGPVLAKLGVESELQVTFYPAHEVYVPQSVRITA